MFGIVLAQLDAIDEAEKARYQQLYCGICHSLKARYGQLTRLCVSYDMAFLALVLDSLDLAEPPAPSIGRCAVHPLKDHAYATGAHVDYAADLSLILAYHKCIDNWEDDRSAPSLAYSKGLARAYAQVGARYPRICRITEQVLAELRRLEAEALAGPAGEAPPAPPETPADEAPPAAPAAQPGADRAAEHLRQLSLADRIANLFGIVMAEMFACDAGRWEADMRELGGQLGRFVYFMDAAVDAKEDAESGSYNPFVLCEWDEEEMDLILRDAAGRTAEAFERLPLERDLHLMRSVLYAGIWSRLAHERE